MTQQVESGSDRDAVLVAASCLEDQLGFAVKCKLRHDDRVVLNELFHMRGPLGTFSAKINLGYLLGLYDKEARVELDTIKRIRNVFAHRPQEASFESQRVRDLANKLSLSQRWEIYTPAHPPIPDLQVGDHVLLGYGLRTTADPEVGEPCLPRVACDVVLSARDKFVRACKHHLVMLKINGLLAAGVAWKDKRPG